MVGRQYKSISLLEDYCSQLGTVLDRRSPGLALVTARQQANQRMLAAEAADHAKTKFLAHMSHELRTPVNGVLGMLELVRHTEPGPKQHHYIETARRSAESLLGIINGILDISKIEAGKLELDQSPFNLREIVEDACDTFAAMAHGKGLALVCSIAADLPATLVGDAGRLRQILTNLIGNAVKFTHKGEVALRVQVAELDAAAALIAFEVSDTGIGIQPEKQKHIFDAFAQADSSTTRRYGGTGLGLSIAKQLSEMMNGAISLTSEPGRGSTFRFTARFGRRMETENPSYGAFSRLPTFDPQAPRPAIATVPAPEIAAGARILLVEDNPVNLEVGVGILESFGCEVETATNGIEALQRYISGEYGVIFMDCQMPEMDGFEATAEIRKQEAASDQRVPIVALTASALEGDRERCLAAGMDDYVPKPFTSGQMRAALAAWLALPRRGGGEARRDHLSAVISASAPAAGCTAQPIDAAVLNRLAQLQRDGRPDIVSRVIALFLDNAPGLLRDLQRAAAGGDMALLNSASHALKAAGANVGAALLSAHCEELEILSRTGRLVDAPARIEIIAEDYRRAEAALTARLPKVA